MNADTHAKNGGELTRLFRHGDNGGTIGDTENAARLAVQADVEDNPALQCPIGLFLVHGVNDDGKTEPLVLVALTPPALGQCSRRWAISVTLATADGLPRAAKRMIESRVRPAAAR